MNAELITLGRLVGCTAEALEPDRRTYTIIDGTARGTFSKLNEMRQAHTLALLEALERGELVARSMHSRAPFKPWPPLAFNWQRDAKQYGLAPTDAAKFCELLAIAPVSFNEPPICKAPKPKVIADWTMQAQKRAREIIKEASEIDSYPPQESIADKIAKEFRRDGVMGVDGKPLTGAYIKRHALRGISSARHKRV